MSAIAFCPGHITCFFHPVRTDDVLTTGSRGVGIRTDLGATVIMEERTDNRLVTVMDGKECECEVTKIAVSEISGRGFDITINNGLPVGQGFGMSAAGAIASALCACVFEGINPDEAYRAAHIAEIRGGGGLGDVSGIMGDSAVPVRAVAGLPPFGNVIGAPVKLGKFTACVLGGPLNTGDTLSDPNTSKLIQTEGSRAVDEFLESPSADRLFELSERFSSGIGLETDALKRSLKILRTKGRAGMCMLGHSIFTDLDTGTVRELLGDDVSLYSCEATNMKPYLIRTV